VRLDIRRIGQLKQGEEMTGSRTRVKVVKNKCAPPFRQAEFEILFGTGINRTGELLDIGAALNLIERNGTWYSFDGERFGPGRDKALAFLNENPEIAASLRERLLSASKTALPMPTEAANDNAEPTAVAA
jgi:recombination protein RecA